MEYIVENNTILETKTGTKIVVFRPKQWGKLEVISQILNERGGGFCGHTPKFFGGDNG